ncbi:MAG: hypothetical protein ACTSPW_20120 [Promethearchaeota archaeon]
MRLFKKRTFTVNQVIELIRSGKAIGDAQNLRSGISDGKDCLWVRVKPDKVLICSWNSKLLKFTNCRKVKDSESYLDYIFDYFRNSFEFLGLLENINLN